MSSYTAQVVLHKPAHNKTKYSVGDIIGIHPLILEAPSKSSRLCLINVIGALIILTLKTCLKSLLGANGMVIQ